MARRTKYNNYDDDFKATDVADALAIHEVIHHIFKKHEGCYGSPKIPREMHKVVLRLDKSVLLD